MLPIRHLSTSTQINKYSLWRLFIDSDMQLRIYLPPVSGWVNSPTMSLVSPLCVSCVLWWWPGDNDQCSTDQLLICTWEPRSLSTNLCNPVYPSLKSHFLFILVQFLRQCHGVLSRGNDLKWGQFQWPLTRLGQQVEANVWKVKGDRPSSPLSPSSQIFCSNSDEMRRRGDLMMAQRM